MQSLQEPRIAIIRTSDRGSFKRCRRKWAFTSHLHHNRTPAEAAEYFWIGTGGHYALEDYHGYNYYKHPVEAFNAYVYAYRKWADRSPNIYLPASIDEQITLGQAMLEYYLIWLEHRDPLQTLWIDDVPQVEVKCLVQLPFSNEYYDEVYYSATFDRVVVIEDELWVQDYKFYNRDWTPQLDFDAQMSAYIWLAEVMYDEAIGLPSRGAIVQKHFKKIPEEPRILASGKISADVSQQTTHRLYRQALMNMYGSVEKAPLANRNCLESLAMEETIDKDKFIQRAHTIRSPEQIASTGEQILMELPEMLNPYLPLYKNDTKDCHFDCSFQDTCIAMDEGMDWDAMLKDMSVSRLPDDEEELKGWRHHLPHLE